MTDSNFDHITQLKSYFQIKNFHPKKQFGQNFLIDKNFIANILTAVQPTQEDLLFEVGPGGGILTRALIKTGLPVVSVEIDDELVAMASHLIGQHDNFTLLHTDVMSRKNELHPLVIETLTNVHCKKIKCAANLPYAIITPFLVTMMSTFTKLDRFTILIQKEIADKICATTSQEEYGILSVIAAIWGESKILKIVPHQAFWPQPKVTSAIVHIQKRNDITNFDFTNFSVFIREMFQQRRKKATQQLKKYFSSPESILEKFQISSLARPEEIPPETWKEIFLILKENNTVP